MSLNVLRDIFVFSCSVVPVRVFATLWMVDCQAPLSMKFSRQEYRNGLQFPSPEDLLDPGIEPITLASPALAGGFFTNCALINTISKQNNKERCF